MLVALTKISKVDSGRDSSGSGRSSGSSSSSYSSLDSVLLSGGREETLRSEDCPSKLGRGYIDFIRARYDMPSCIGRRYLLRGEKLEEPSVGHVGFYLKMFEFNVCLLLPVFAREFLNEVNLAPAQLSPMGGRCCTGVIISSGGNVREENTRARVIPSCSTPIP